MGESMLDKPHNYFSIISHVELIALSPFLGGDMLDDNVRHGFLRHPVHVAEVSDTFPYTTDEVRVGKPPPDYLSDGAREVSKNLRYRRHHTSD